MEVLLNLVWLITTALLFVLLLRQLPRNGRGPRICERYLAVTVLSFLLLPVISMTDDLLAMTMLAEGERTCYKEAAAADHPFHAAQPVFLTSAGGDALLVASFFCFGVIDAPKDALAVPSRFFPSRSGRAPPAHAGLYGLS